MAFTLNKNDRELLTLIAEYRLLTVSQIAALIRRNDRSVRRRVRGFANEHLIEVFTRSFGSGRGRPEGLVSLAWRGIDVLRKDGVLRGDLADDRIKTLKAHYVDHQLLVNWFRIHLVELERVVPQLLVRFLAPTSPFLDRGPDDWPLISERVTLGGTPERSTTFVPDGVFSITDGHQGKTLLFFVEADMGTESLGSSKDNSGAIRQKIVNYQAYFRSGAYRRYEDVWSCSLKGLRLLFFTVSSARLAALCRVVQDTPPSDFVWLTDTTRVLEHGVSASIWARGGKMDTEPESILGTLACRAPISGTKS